nr:hypothetical protein [Orientia tsutsugamushi]
MLLPLVVLMHYLKGEETGIYYIPFIFKKLNNITGIFIPIH